MSYPTTEDRAIYWALRRMVRASCMFMKVPLRKQGFRYRSTIPEMICSESQGAVDDEKRQDNGTTSSEERGVAALAAKF